MPTHQFRNFGLLFAALEPLEGRVHRLEDANMWRGNAADLEVRAVHPSDAEQHAVGCDDRSARRVREDAPERDVADLVGGECDVLDAAEIENVIEGRIERRLATELGLIRDRFRERDNAGALRLHAPALGVDGGVATQAVNDDSNNSRGQSTSTAVRRERDEYLHGGQEVGASARTPVPCATMCGVIARAVAAVFILLLAPPVFAFDGRVLDARTEQPVANAELTILGVAGSVRTDADGRFVWRPDPRPPFEILVILPGGELTKPVLVQTAEWGAVLTIRVLPMVSEEVNVAAGAAPSIDATAGSGTTMLAGREIARREPATLVQALENVPGVHQVSEGHAAVPAVRGLSSGRTLILIDGGRVTSERRVGPSATFLDPASLESVDVARGPGSVAYGSDAFGGVISIRMRRPEPGSPLRVRVTGTLAAGTPEQRGAIELSKGFSAGGIVVQAHARHAEDYRAGDGATIVNSGWQDGGVSLRVENTLGRGHFAAGYQSDLASDVERPRNNSTSIRLVYPFERSHRATASYELTGVAGLSKVIVNGFFGTYAQRTDQDRFATATSGRTLARADVSANDFGVRAIAERFAGPARIEFGVDVNGRAGLHATDLELATNVAGRETLNRTTVSVDSAARTDAGAFVQAFASLLKRAIVSAGARVDRVVTRNHAGFFGDRHTSNGAGSGMAALTVGPFAALTVTGQVSHGFRDPMLSDRYYRGPTGRGFITGNPDLDPERSLQFDLAVRHTAGRLRSAAYAYEYRISDLVERYQTSTDFFFFRNRGRARLRGFELEAQGDLGGGFSAQVSGQISRGTALDDGANVDGIAPQTLAIALRRQFANRGYAHVRSAFVGAYDRPGPTERAMPGYTVVDAGAGWPIGALELRGTVRNLLDTEYLASPDPRTVLAPGISATVTLVATF